MFYGTISAGVVLGVCSEEHWAAIAGVCQLSINLQKYDMLCHNYNWCIFNQKST